MEVDKGKALANAFISMEDLFREHKDKADRENDDVVTLCNAAGEGCPILSTRIQSYPLAFHRKTGSLLV